MSSYSLAEWVLVNSSDRHSLCLPCPTVLKQGGTGGLLQRAGRGQLLNGNVLVTYVTLIPWRRERRCTSHRHCCWTPLMLPPYLFGSSAKTWRCTCCSLYTRAERWAAAAYNCIPMCIGSFWLHSKQIGLSSKIPIHRSVRRTSPFPPSGNEGCLCNRDIPCSRRCVTVILLWTA